MTDFCLNFGEEISLQKIYESGQCFRWTPLGDGTYQIIAGTHLADVAQDGSAGIQVRAWKNADEKAVNKEEQDFWADYFDQDTSYTEIRKKIPAYDTYLRQAARAGSGIRILRQDPWEMIVTFIISQRKNIPAIRTCVEKLCRTVGEKHTAGLHSSTNTEDFTFYSFPAPEKVRQIFCCRTEGLPENGPVSCVFKRAGYENCSLGYRMPYILDAARWMENVNLADLRKLNDEDLFNRLSEIKGVGVKVAACIMLFGFHRLNAFPVDVWMNRVLAAHYPEGFDMDRYAPYAGVMQQYLFFQVREESTGTKTGLL